MHKVRIHEAADEEMNSAAAYYEAREIGLGEAFLAEISRGIRQIQTRPLAWPTLIDDYRRYVLNRFPYVLIYRVDADDILVLAVAHSHRKPGYWRSRLG